MQKITKIAAIAQLVTVNLLTISLALFVGFGHKSPFIIEESVLDITMTILVIISIIISEVGSQTPRIMKRFRSGIKTEAYIHLTSILQVACFGYVGIMGNMMIFMGGSIIMSGFIILSSTVFILKYWPTKKQLSLIRKALD